MVLVLLKTMNDKKIFNTFSVSHKDLRALIVSFAKSLGVKRVTFSNKALYVRGTYNAFTGSLFLDMCQTITIARLLL